jgi:hypothetical protein
MLLLPKFGSNRRCVIKLEELKIISRIVDGCMLDDTRKKEDITGVNWDLFPVQYFDAFVADGRYHRFALIVIEIEEADQPHEQGFGVDPMDFG